MPPTLQQRGSQLRKLTSQQLKSAMDVITSRFGTQRAGLQAQESGVEDAYQRLIANLGRQRSRTLETNIGASLDRGLLRSGIHRSREAETMRDFAEAETEAGLQRQTAMAEIARALGMLPAQEASARADVSTQFALQQLQIDQILAALGQLAQPRNVQQAGPVLLSPSEIEAALRRILGR